MSLTWKEFKELIDKQLQEKKISEDTKIWYIDVSFPGDDAVEVEVGYSSEMNMIMI